MKKIAILNKISRKVEITICLQNRSSVLELQVFERVVESFATLSSLVCRYRVAWFS